MSETNTNHNPNDIIEVSEETLAKIKAINVNMVLVLSDVEKVEEAAEVTTEKVIEEVAEKPKSKRK